MESLLLNPRVYVWTAVALFLGVSLSAAGGLILKNYGLRRLLGIRTFGNSHWARPHELFLRGFFRSGGLLLGRRNGLSLFDNEDGHLVTIAGTGGGKSSGLVVPALLEGRRGSFVVSDPSGELAAMTRRHRETIGPVYLLNPWASDFEADTGLSFPDSGFNPLTTLEDGPNLVDDARNLAKLLMVTDRVDSGSYWNRDGARLLAGLIVWMKRCEPAEHHTLSHLHRMVYGSDILNQFMWMAEQTYDPFLESVGSKFEAMSKHAPAQFEGVISKAQDAIDPYTANTPLGLHTARDGLSLDVLKRENATVYLLVPSGRMKVAQPWLNLIIGLTGQEVGKPGPRRPVTVLLDELPALGYVPDLRDFMRQYRKAGLKMWLFSQTAAALAGPELYGREGLEDIFGLCRIKQFFAIEEPELARRISEWCGQRSVVNVSAGAGGASMGDTGRPLVTPEEVRGLKRGRQIIISGGMRPPIMARLVPYFKRRKWRSLVDPNPYRAE